MKIPFNQELFFQKLSSTLDGMPREVLSPDQAFRDLAGWSSIQALVFIAFINTEYEVVISHEELKKARTFHDIILLIKERC